MNGFFYFSLRKPGPLGRRGIISFEELFVVEEGVVDLFVDVGFPS